MATSRPSREADLQRSEIISLPLAALALLLVFGSVVAAGVPLVVGGAAVIVALAALFVVASLTPMSIFVLNLATLLGLGLGVDYSLLLTSRFREELASAPTYPRSASRRRSVPTVVTAGRAVFFSGLTVLLGLLGLVLFEFMILRSVGIAGAIVVGLAVASALTLLPAILTDRSVRGSTASQSVGCRRPQNDGPWARLARWVMRRPVAVLVPTLAAPLLLGSPFLHVRFNAPDSSSCRRPSRRAPRSIAFGRSSARGNSPDRRCHPDRRARDVGREPGRALRLFATARDRRARPRWRDSSISTPA